MNMSYCRFRNTLMVLQDCQNWLQDIKDGVIEPDEKLSREEEHAYKQLVELCHNIVLDHYDEEGEPTGEWRNIK